MLLNQHKHSAYLDFRYLSLETAAVHNEAKVPAAHLDINGPWNI